MLTCGGFGSAQRTTYFFQCEEDIFVRCGCFHGTLDEWKEAVTKTHGDTPIAQAYLTIAKAVELQWEKPPAEGEAL